MRGRSVLSLAAGARIAVARPRQTIMLIHVATDTAAGTVDNPAALPPHLRVLDCPAHDTGKGSWWPMGCDGTAIHRARLKLIDRRPTATGAIPVALATFYRRWFIEKFKKGRPRGGVADASRKPASSPKKRRGSVGMVPGTAPMARRARRWRSERAEILHG